MGGKPQLQLLYTKVGVAAANKIIRHDLRRHGILGTAYPVRLSFYIRSIHFAVYSGVVCGGGGGSSSSSSSSSCCSNIVIVQYGNYQSS